AEFRLRTNSVLRQLSLPAMPPVKIVDCLPVPSVKLFHFEKLFVAAGVKAPAALKCGICGHDDASFWKSVVIYFCRTRRSGSRRVGGRFSAVQVAVGQARVPAQRTTPVAAKGPRGKRRKLTGTIRLEEGLAGESESFKPRQNLPQLRFGFHAAQNQMGMAGD